ncbi:MAG: 50S ribosomal protein L6 [Bacillota bacterium]|nr:50S ribosomal protein L6 [Bacillota bacterium]
MSRVGKKPIPIPHGVEVRIDGQEVRVKGPLGELQHRIPEGLQVTLEDGVLKVEREGEDRDLRAFHGLTRALLHNLVQGVSSGFQKTLELVGTGYRAQKQGEKLVLAVGYSHPVEIVPPAGIQLEAPAPNVVVVKGADKQKVGQMAAQIRAVREPEPYLGKGIRYQGEKVRRKAGKSGK